MAGFGDRVLKAIQLTIKRLGHSPPAVKHLKTQKLAAPANSGQVDTCNGRGVAYVGNEGFASLGDGAPERTDAPFQVHCLLAGTNLPVLTPRCVLS